VLGILKELKVPKSIETQMAGEALFNDGVGVVLFIVLMRIAMGGPGASLGQSALLFAKEAFGGILIGLAIGWIAYQMLKRVDNYQVEVLITLGLVMGGYDLAHRLHTSGPLAIVAAGLLIGNHGRAFAMSEPTLKNLDTFWELIDEILNAILFILIGIEVLVLEINFHHFFAGLMIIPLVLLVRLLSVGIPFGLIGQRMPSRKNAVKILTWGGMRGGIAVALALSIPQGAHRGIIVFITYMVVVFSIIVQGLTIKKFLRKWGV
jgi:CPA1 family monovalent cation:H+ antiporter